MDADPEIRRDAITRLVLGLVNPMLPGSRLDELQTPRVRGLFRQLRQRVMLALVFTILMAPITIWLLIRGLATYVAVHAELSGFFRLWLVFFLALQAAWPIRMPTVTLILFSWCWLAFILCGEPVPADFWSFLLEACVLQTVQAMLLVAAAVASLTARPLMQQLSDLLQHSGTDPEVLLHIDVLAPAEISAEEECVICLSREDEDGVPWRRLCCQHAFHETCLLEWLDKARRCPVCRLDLHEAYRHCMDLDSAV